MILSKFIKIEIKPRNINIYKSKGYICNLHDTIDVDVNDINIGSHITIRVKCEICGNERDLKTKSYWKNHNNHNFYCCHKCSYIKISMTCLEKYNVINPMQIEGAHERMQETNKKLYGNKYPLQNINIRDKFETTMLKLYNNKHALQCDELVERAKKTKRDNGSSTIHTNDFLIYRNKVRNLTNINKKVLFDIWDGYDYYDGELIRNHLDDKFSKNYPTIDHKESVLYGFQNDITPEEISHIDNLCITKMYINSTKGSKCHDEFIKLII